MRKTLRQLAADPQYMTPLDVRREVMKATDEFNEYMMRSVNGSTGHDLHLLWEEEVRKLMKEPNLKIREEGLRDLSNGTRFKKHRETMSRLLTAKKYWDQLSEKVGVSNGTYQLAQGVMPQWRKRLDDPFFDDPDKARKPSNGRKIFATSHAPRELEIRGNNELYKGLAK